MTRKTMELVKKLRKAVAAVAFFPDLSGVPFETAIQTLTRLSSIRGTAFAVSPNHFLTCYHVIRQALSSPGTLKLIGSADPAARGPMFICDGTSVQHDAALDLALIEVRQVRGEAMPLELEPERPEVGLDIITVGYPLPEQRSEVREAEKEVEVEVAATFRVLRGIVASWLRDGVHFEIDKHVNPGQSGGPVVGLETERVIGLCQAFRRFPIDSYVLTADLAVCVSLDSARATLTQWGLRI